jgi:arylsulfatase A-like enzyme
VYENQALVPLILWSPGEGLPRGVVVDRPVRLLDLMPTVLDFVDAPMPEGLEGRSLLPLARDPAAEIDLPAAFVVETHFREAEKLAAYAEGWKYVLNLDGHPGAPAAELQPDGPEDGLRTDRSADEAGRVAELQAFLDAWQAAHPPALPTLSADATPEDMKRQLEALGYTE